MDERTDVELMLALQAGDEAAFRTLVERHHRKVVNLAYRYTQNRADAEDLAQEVFLRVHKAAARWRPDARFTTWLYRVAANASLNELRSRKSRATHRATSLSDGAGVLERGVLTLPDERGDSPLTGAARSELQAQVRAAVAELPERQRLAIVLNKFHGLGYAELASTLGLSIPATKSLLVRARENLRGIIGPLLDKTAEGTHG